MRVYEWLEIADDFTHGLVLGNGASIAFDDRFSYRSLREEAQLRDFITDPLVRIFAHLGTTDFELVLRVLWHANTVNEALEIEDAATESAYRDVRIALIETVRAIHASYDSVFSRLQEAAAFMERFGTVASLNYDLLAYWAAMFRNKESSNRFKDCFHKGEFQHNWKRYRKPYGATRSTTLLFFPHGNLVLGADITGVETKIKAHGFRDLLRTVTTMWENGEVTPVFVSEGTSQQKLHGIRRSAYLSTIYEEVLPALGESVVIYGWSLSDHDDHLLAAICKGEPKRFAVSIQPSAPRAGEYAARVRRKLKNLLAPNTVRIVFFDAGSPDCWVAH